VQSSENISGGEKVAIVKQQFSGARRDCGLSDPSYDH